MLPACTQACDITGPCLTYQRPTTSLKKTDFPSWSNMQLPKAPQLRMGAHKPLPHRWWTVDWLAFVWVLPRQPLWIHECGSPVMYRRPFCCGPPWPSTSGSYIFLLSSMGLKRSMTKKKSPIMIKHSEENHSFDFDQEWVLHWLVLTSA